GDRGMARQQPVGAVAVTGAGRAPLSPARLGVREPGRQAGPVDADTARDPIPGPPAAPVRLPVRRFLARLTTNSLPGSVRVARVPYAVQAPGDGQDTEVTWARPRVLSAAVPGTSTARRHRQACSLTTNA